MVAMWLLDVFRFCYSTIYLIDFIGAGDGIRTHDPNLGKVVLYP
jgi:hypothetical protein